MNIHLGQMHAESFATDPKHLGFVLRRYHFVARMLRGAGSVLEVGCGDCTGAPIVRAAVGHLEGCDAIAYSGAGIPVHIHDMLSGPLLHRVSGSDGEWMSLDCEWDAIYALDVLEHVPIEHEDRFFRNINASLAANGKVIIGSPSLESQPYASWESKKHHVNCKNGANFIATLERHYYNVFLLGLNDYALHDGFDQMVHYRLALCTGKKS